MREIDCSKLPDNLAKIALDAAKKTIERSPYDANGVNVLENTQLVTLNTVMDAKHFDCTVLFNKLC